MNDGKGGWLGEGGGRTYDKTKCKPRVGFDDFGGVVAAVVTAADNALVALDFTPECGLATGEDETHRGRYMLTRTCCWCGVTLGLGTRLDVVVRFEERKYDLI